MRISLIFAVSCALVLGAKAADKALENSGPPLAKSGDIVFDLNLSDPDIRAQIEKQGGSVVDEGPNGEPVLRVSNTSGLNSRILSFPIHVDPLRGAKLAVIGEVRGEGIEPLEASVPLRTYQGMKFQLLVESPTDGKRFFDAGKLHGTFPWHPAGKIASIPDDAAKASINLGIEKAGGTAWYARVRVRVLQNKSSRPLAAGPSESQNVKLRGVMSPPAFNLKDFDDLASWKVNLIRWQMRQPNDGTPYQEWLETKLAELERVLAAARERGIKVVIDLHSPPGGRLPDGTMRMLLEKEYQDQFIRNWEMIAHRFKGSSGIYGYDLINEPVQSIPSPEGLSDWLAIQVKAGQAIRRIDSETPIIIEVDEWDSPESFKWLEPLNIPHLIYQAHMYWPGEYTHQGVRTNQGVAKDKNSEQAIPYPGMNAGKPMDKEALRRYLAPVRRFQLAHGAVIYIGEFSAVRWAPGAAQYLDDCVSIFEEYGWNWSYHAFREWQGWSVEHADLPRDRNNHPKAVTPTARQKVLHKWFSKNMRS